jgi:ABC-type Fe3+/spermidine/putrescine transport system ATPase subunit
MDLRAKDNISLAEAQKDTMAIWALVEEKEARLLDKTLAPEDEKTKTEAQAETIAAQAQSIKELGDRQGTEADF